MSTTLDRILTHRPCSMVELRRWRFNAPTTHWCAPGAHAGTLEIAWVSSGRVTYRLGRRELTLQPGAAVLVPPDVEHATGFVDPVVPVDAGAIHLDATLLAEVAEVLGAGARRPQPVVVPNAERMVAICRLLMDRASVTGTGTGTGTGSQLAAEALAEVLAVEVLQAGPACGQIDSPGAPTDRRISAAVEQIETCYAQALCVDELARTAAMSRFHFSRRFREIMGQSPYRYLIETRLRHAAALLRRGHHSVTDAALSAGFTDLGRFSRMFRQWSGTAPHCYGRSCSGDVGVDASAVAARSAHNSARTA